MQGKIDNGEKVEGKRIELLWNSFLSGNEKSFDHIYLFYVDKLFAYGAKFTTDLALIQDTLQEVFITLYQRKDKKHNNVIVELKPYLFVSFRNNLLCQLKKRKAQFVSTVQGELQLNWFSVEYSIEDRITEEDMQSAMNARLARAMQDLSARQKEILYLRYTEEMEYKEISTTLGISIDSCRKLMYRSLTTLREVLKK